MHQLISALLVHLAHAGAARERDDRGDVPGWVMVTLMSAIVITALIPVVRGELVNMLERAFAMVGG